MTRTRHFRDLSNNAIKGHLKDLPPDRLRRILGEIEMAGDLSDGYHTFNELYDHRALLTAALFVSVWQFSWRSKAHHPDDQPMYDGYFIAGHSVGGGEITYHYPLKYWDLFDTLETLDHAPKWDGETPAQGLERLRFWIEEMQAMNRKSDAQAQAQVEYNRANQPPLPPKCDACGEYAPYGDERNSWIGWHKSWLHRLWCRLKRGTR